MPRFIGNKVVGGALLVAGTCIGAGMLGLPISTAASGMFPSVVAFIICWMLNTLTAFFMLEVSLCYPEQTNLITMARATLGRVGAWFCWFCYLLFLYSLMAAYTSGASGILGMVLEYLGLSAQLALPVFIIFFAIIVFLGTRWVDMANRIMMCGLIAAYSILIMVVVPKVSVSGFEAGDVKYIWLAGPLLVTSFGFHLLIPSLKNYFHGDISALRWSIFLGSLLPLIVYLFWEFIILGVVPSGGADGLIAMNQTEQPVLSLTQSLSNSLDNIWVKPAARIFSFCAILTSFIGVSLGLFDFLADGFHVKKTNVGKGLLAMLTFIPPALFVIFYPSGFLMALRYAGVFAAILLVIYPALMVWQSRYRLQQARAYQVTGGKVFLVIAILFGVGIIGLEICQELALLPAPTV